MIGKSLTFNLKKLVFLLLFPKGCWDVPEVLVGECWLEEGSALLCLQSVDDIPA